MKQKSVSWILGAGLLLSGFGALFGCHDKDHDIYETQTELSFYYVPLEAPDSNISTILSDLNPSNSTILSSYKTGRVIDVYENHLSDSHFHIQAIAKNSYNDTVMVNNFIKGSFNSKDTNNVKFECSSTDVMVVSPKFKCTVNGQSEESEIGTPQNGITRAKLYFPIKNNKAVIVASYMSHMPIDEKTDQFTKLHTAQEGIKTLREHYPHLVESTKLTYEFLSSE